MTPYQNFREAVQTGDVWELDAKRRTRRVSPEKLAAPPYPEVVHVCAKPDRLRGSVELPPEPRAYLIFDDEAGYTPVIAIAAPKGQGHNLWFWAKLQGQPWHALDALAAKERYEDWIACAEMRLSNGRVLELEIPLGSVAQLDGSHRQ